MGIIHMKWNDQEPGAHPTDDISIEFDQNLECSSLKHT